MSGFVQTQERLGHGYAEKEEAGLRAYTTMVKEGWQEIQREVVDTPCVHQTGDHFFTHRDP